MDFKIWAYVALAVLIVWGLTKITGLVRRDERRKSDERAKKDEKKKVTELAERLYDGHDINSHFGVRHDKTDTSSDS